MWTIVSPTHTLRYVAVALVSIRPIACPVLRVEGMSLHRYGKAGGIQPFREWSWHASRSSETNQTQAMVNRLIRGSIFLVMCT
jgi:hypothetical protein